MPRRDVGEAECIRLGSSDEPAISHCIFKIYIAILSIYLGNI
jgi:hypothetical protein